MITDHILPAKFFVLVYTTIGMLSFANNSAFADAHQSNVDKPTILITGSNRGIGLEFVRQLSLRDWRIIATARAPQDACPPGKRSSRIQNRWSWNLAKELVVPACFHPGKGKLA